MGINCSNCKNAKNENEIIIINNEIYHNNMAKEILTKHYQIQEILNNNPNLINKIIKIQKIIRKYFKRKSDYVCIYIIYFLEFLY